jgi:hypothetical protein
MNVPLPSEEDGYGVVQASNHIAETLLALGQFSHSDAIPAASVRHRIIDRRREFSVAQTQGYIAFATRQIWNAIPV